MFTFDSLVETSTKTTKQALAHVQNEDIRSNLETLVDAQAAFAKTVYNTGLDIAKTTVENFTKYNSELTQTKSAKK